MKKNIILPYKHFKTVNNNKNKKKLKIKKAKTIEVEPNLKNLTERKKERNIKEKILKKEYNTVNVSKNDENKNIFKTKYDYILQKGKISNGPVELPSDIEIQQNLNQKEWISQKKILKENVKRSDIIKKIKIFNNKKNNNICSNILKKMKENEKELILFPYAKKKQMINKTINTIGPSNGITYLKTSVLSGGNEKNFYNNFINIIRTNENKNNLKMKMINIIQNKYVNKAEIDLY